jgi:alkanesulfonate monooxygenase SsuD/methylene tetrahydromethanopterin reductase-like flavin-dependent oxidoreductase (luciferase family)
MMSPGPQLDEARDIVARSAIAAGRDPAAIGMEGRVTWLGDPRQVADELAQWTAAGATHVSVNTMGAGLRTVDEHLAALAAVAENLPVYHPQ